MATSSVCTFCNILCLASYFLPFAVKEIEKVSGAQRRTDLEHLTVDLCEGMRKAYMSGNSQEDVR